MRKGRNRERHLKSRSIHFGDFRRCQRIWGIWKISFMVSCSKTVIFISGHLTEESIAYYQATGKDKLLNAAKRFADYISGFFGDGEGKCKGYPGHEIAEMALVRLYEVTGCSACDVPIFCNGGPCKALWG